MSNNDAAIIDGLFNAGMKIDTSALNIHQRPEALELLSLMFRAALANVETNLTELPKMRLFVEGLIKNMAMAPAERAEFDRQMSTFLFAQDIRVMGRRD